MFLNFYFNIFSIYLKKNLHDNFVKFLESVLKYLKVFNYIEN